MEGLQRSRIGLVSFGTGLLFVIAILIQYFGAAGAIDRLVLDTAFRVNRHIRPVAVSDEPVIVGIDEAFLNSIDEPLALTHAYLARFLLAMQQARARVVGLDLVLPEKRFSSPAHDNNAFDLHQSLLASLLATSHDVPIVAAKVWDSDHGRFRDIQVDFAAVLQAQHHGIEAHASAIFCNDTDGRVRAYPGPDCQPGGRDITFAAEVSAAMGRRNAWRGLIDYRVGPPFSYVPLRQVLDMQRGGDRGGLQQLFQGKAVLLGLVGDDADMLTVPVALAAWRPSAERVPGVLAHAQTLRSMLNGGLLQPVSLGWLMLLSGLSALFWLTDAVARKLSCFGILAIALLALVAYLLRAGIWLAPGGILLSGSLACGGRSALEGWRSWRERRRLSATFSGYVSPEVMNEIIDGGIAPDQQGQKLTVCVLFSDIRSFTTLSEHLPAEEVVSILNRYFARMTAVIHHHGGTVDKFIGDGLMAFFGAPNLMPQPCDNAVRASQAMFEELEELNGEFAAEQRAPLVIGIGLHVGEAVIGYVGSPQRHSYTAIGDTVNAAARLEGLCKELQYPLICSDSVARALGHPAGIVALGAHPLKGRSPMFLYGWRPDTQNATLPRSARSIAGEEHP